MKKTVLLIFCTQIIFWCNARAQISSYGSFQASKSLTTPAAPAPDACSVEQYKDKTYIFDGNAEVFESDGVGQNTSANSTIVYAGSRFHIVYVDKTTCNLVIQFNIWKLAGASDLAAVSKRSTYNFKQNADAVSLTKKKASDEDVRYFVLTKSDFTSSCSVYVNPKSLSVTLGSFITPFKFRPTKSIFTSNLNLGTAVYFNKPISTNTSVGFVFGISLSSVTLDSLSTGGLVKSSDRPALTPSVSLVYSYKTINFTLGGGIDYINKTSVIEKSWIYNGKPWIGFGIGLNLFSSSDATTTAKTQKQSN